MAEEKSLPRVGIIIVTYNGWADTEECLASLQKLTYPNYFVIVVDQASHDGTVDFILRAFPDVLLIANDINDGFAAGNNRGALLARREGAEYVFLLNNDTIVAPEILEPLIAAAEGDPRIAIAGPLMFYYDSPTVVWSAGGTMGSLGESVMREQGRVIPPVEEIPPLPGSARIVDVDFVVGCGMLIRWALLEQIGLMDEHYFLYYEEADLCARAEIAGWRTVTARSSKLWHKISRSTGTDSDLTLYYMRRNVLLYLEKNAAGSSFARLRVIADSARLCFVWLVKGRIQRSTVAARANVDYFLRRFGRADWLETQSL